MRRSYLILLGLILLAPVVTAYPQQLHLISIWDVIVEGLFGSFWISVIAIAATYFLIMALGNVSLTTNGYIVAMFLLAMGIGYGEPLISFGISMFITVSFFYQIYKWSSDRI